LPDDHIHCKWGKNGNNPAEKAIYTSHDPAKQSFGKVLSATKQVGGAEIR
jgi:hypothetical protein